MPEEEKTPLLSEEVRKAESKEEKPTPSDPVYRREDRLFEDEDEKPKGRFGRKTQVAVVLLAFLVATVVVQRITAESPPPRRPRELPEYTFGTFLEETKSRERQPRTAGEFDGARLKPPPPGPSMFTKFVNKAYELIGQGESP